MTTNDKTREALRVLDHLKANYKEGGDPGFDILRRHIETLASTPTQPPVAAVPHKSIATLLQLVGDYWDLAHAEGKEARDHDTTDSAATTKWNAIRTEALRLAATPTPAPSEQGDMRNESSLISDLTLLVGRMARRLRITDPGSVHVAGNKALAEQAVEFIKRQRLVSPLRNDCGDAAQGEVVARYHAWCGGIADETALRRAVSVMDDVLGDIAGWEDTALAEAVEEVKRDLQAMADCIQLAAAPERAEVRPPVLTDALRNCLRVAMKQWAGWLDDARGVAPESEEWAQCVATLGDDPLNPAADSAKGGALSAPSDGMERANVGDVVWFRVGRMYGTPASRPVRAMVTKIHDGGCVDVEIGCEDMSEVSGSASKVPHASSVPQPQKQWASCWWHTGLPGDEGGATGVSNAD